MCCVSLEQNFTDECGVQDSGTGMPFSICTNIICNVYVFMTGICFFKDKWR